MISVAPMNNYLSRGERGPTPLGSFRGWKHRDSSFGPEDIRCGGRSLGTCLDEILPDSERGDKEFVFVGPPHEERVQNVV
jgi:hypothetical protein